MGLVSVAEAAKFLGVSEETVKRRIRRGELFGKQHPRPQGYAWMVEIPDELGANGANNHDTRHNTPTEHDDTTTTQHHDTDHHATNGVSAGEMKRLDQVVAILEKQMSLHQEELESRRRDHLVPARAPVTLSPSYAQRKDARNMPGSRFALR